MLPNAYIVHQLKNRTRLRVPDKRGDSGYFEQAGDRLASVEGVSGYNTNTVAGCIVLHHPESDWPDLSERIRELDLFDITAAPVEQTPAMQPLITELNRLDRAVGLGSEGRLDLRTIAYLALMILAVRQILQGQVLGPAVPMLLNAWALADKFVSKRQAGTGE